MLEKTVYAKLMEQRMQALAAADRRQAEAESKITGLARINSEISSIGPRLLAIGMAGGEDYEKRCAELYDEHEKLVDEKRALLVANGFSADYDMPVFTCKKCSDTGYVGSEICQCLKTAKAKSLYYNSGLGKALDGQTFNSLDLSYYTGATNKGYSVKDIMLGNLQYCKDYAENFKSGAENLLLIGGAGLGKTHFASAIGHEVINKGYSVVYESAQTIMETFEKEHFGKEPQTADPTRFLKCDLLIMDDLGTEFATSFTVTALFALINTRIVNGLSTIITTNLNFAEIEANYKERISSRLRGEYTTLVFCGKDIRRAKKENR